MLQYASICSGSNGNCYYVGNGTNAVLIDVGISCKELDKRMQRLGLDPQSLSGIFISHEHTDHIHGLRHIVNRWAIPVYMSRRTYASCRQVIDPTLLHFFEPGSATTIGALTVHAFGKCHDAAEPCSFSIEGKGFCVGVFTDLGKCCDALADHFNRCDVAFLESNYDSDMLRSGRYPAHLKRRITGGDGHLSNTEALEVFLKHRSPRLQHLLLAHLSANNNRPELVQETFAPYTGVCKMTVASRWQESPLFHLTQKREAPALSVLSGPAVRGQVQMKLMF